MAPLTSLDVSKVLTGADGELWAAVAGQPLAALAHVDEFTFTSGFQNADLHPVGQYTVFGVPVSVTWRLSLSEPQILEVPGASTLITAMGDALTAGCPVVFSFAGYQMEPCAAGDEKRAVGHVYFDSCVPDGDVDLFSIRPGEIQRRRWNFRCNSRPRFSGRSALT